MNSFELIVVIFVSFVIGSFLTFIFFHKTYEKCEHCEEAFERNKDTWLGYYQLFTVIQMMFEDGLSYEEIKETVEKTHSLIAKAERTLCDEWRTESRV